MSVSMYGDGAANQGQVWEAANIAHLWKLPAIYLIENNEYGMGTSTDRHSCNNEYYTSGGRVIPGLQINGMDVLAVREGMRVAKEYAANGNGPLFVEVKTYRYHGHSMSDPGITYRDRDEVSGMRKNMDCIQNLKTRIIDSGAATADDLKVRTCAAIVSNVQCLTLAVGMPGHREGGARGHRGRSEGCQGRLSAGPRRARHGHLLRCPAAIHPRRGVQGQQVPRQRVLSVSEDTRLRAASREWW